MQKVLITGFEPFDGERVNPSWEVVKQLNDLELGGAHIIARQLPCVFGEALTVLNAAIDEVQPAMVLAIGQAGGRTDITLERVAINVDDARIPDNQGQQPIDQATPAQSEALATQNGLDKERIGIKLDRIPEQNWFAARFGEPVFPCQETGAPDIQM